MFRRRLNDMNVRRSFLPMLRIKCFMVVSHKCLFVEGGHPFLRAKSPSPTSFAVKIHVQSRFPYLTLKVSVVRARHGLPPQFRERVLQQRDLSLLQAR